MRWWPRKNREEDLERELPREVRQWVQATLEALSAHSPTMLYVTREALLRGAQMTLAECFRMELGIVKRVIEEGDFREGVRAQLIDKDRRPRWAPATLAEVRAATSDLLTLFANGGLAPPSIVRYSLKDFQEAVSLADGEAGQQKVLLDFSEAPA